jgi:hypothetical protein
MVSGVRRRQSDPYGWTRTARHHDGAPGTVRPGPAGDLAGNTYASSYFAGPESAKWRQRPRLPPQGSEQCKEPNDEKLLQVVTSLSLSIGRHSSGLPGRARRLLSRDRNERAPDITVEADGRAETTNVLVAKELARTLVRTWTATRT